MANTENFVNGRYEGSLTLPESLISVGGSLDLQNDRRYAADIIGERLSRELRAVIDGVSVIDTSTGEEVLEYATCYVAIVETLNNTLAVPIRVEFQAVTRQRAEEVLAAIRAIERESGCSRAPRPRAPRSTSTPTWSTPASPPTSPASWSSPTASPSW